MRRSEAVRLRRGIETGAGHLPDAAAPALTELFPVWQSGALCPAGFRVRYGGVLYKCLTEHRAQPDWSPEAAPSLWAKVPVPDPEVIPDWEQPDSVNGYAPGDRVRYNGRVWVSIHDGMNVWAPGTYGWTEATAC